MRSGTSEQVQKEKAPTHRTRGSSAPAASSGAPQGRRRGWGGQRVPEDRSFLQPHASIRWLGYVGTWQGGVNDASKS